MLRSPLRLAALSIALLLCTSPAHGQQPAGRPRSNANNTLTDAERAAGWRLLFDGSTTNGWRGYKSQTLPPAWHVEDGTLTKNTGTDDIITTDKFANFELDLDWQLAPKGNAGVFYRGTEEYDHIYWSAPEYQLLDDKGHADGKNRKTAAGAAYAIYRSPAGYLHASLHEFSEIFGSAKEALPERLRGRVEEACAQLLSIERDPRGSFTYTMFRARAGP